jgi:hypothetical protein
VTRSTEPRFPFICNSLYRIFDRDCQKNFEKRQNMTFHDISLVVSYRTVVCKVWTVRAHAKTPLHPLPALATVGDKHLPWQLGSQAFMACLTNYLCLKMEVSINMATSKWMVYNGTSY